MAFHRCKICKLDGQLVCVSATVNLEEVKGAMTEWYGTISAAELTSLGPGERYRLVLDDGRSGEILVRRNTSAGEADRAIAFRGAGPLA
jgi:hypothetical protein